MTTWKIEKPSADDQVRLAALGQRLRELRTSAGLGLGRLAVLTGIKDATLQSVELARHRTRASSVRRVVAALVDADPALGTVEELMVELMAIAAGTLAAESEFVDRIERRRTRRVRKMAELMAIGESVEMAWWETRPRRGPRP